MDNYLLRHRFQGNSIICSLNPLTRFAVVVMAVSAAVFSRSWVSLAALILLTILVNILAGLSFRRFLADIRTFWFLYAVSIVIHSFSGGKGKLFELPLGLTIYSAGVERGVFFSLQIAAIVTLSGAIMRTMHPSDLAEAIHRLFPAGLRKGISIGAAGFVLSLAVRFLPMLLDELNRIRIAQTSRGLETGGGIVQKAKSIPPLLIPLISGCLHKADTITSAMYSRGFNLETKRTVYRRMQFKARDAIAVIIVIVLVSTVFF